MIDIKAIREAAEAALMDDKSPGGIGVSTAIRYVATANPSTVLALCDEVERLTTIASELQDLCDRQAMRLAEAEKELMFRST